MEGSRSLFTEKKGRRQRFRALDWKSRGPGLKPRPQPCLYTASWFDKVPSTYSLSGGSMSSVFGSKNFKTVSQDEIFGGNEMRS